MADAAFQDRLDQVYPDSHAKQRALRRLRARMDAHGRVCLTGGVRGWAETLGCGRGYPREMLAEMADEEMIALDILREPGGWVAQIVVLAAFAPADRSADVPAAVPTPLEPSRGSHQNAENDSADRSTADPPHTPLYGTYHDSEQQQQGPHTVSSEQTPHEAPDREGWVRQLWRENAYERFPHAERAAVDYLFADRFNDPMAIWRWLDAEPTMTLARARRQLVNAAGRDDFERHRGAAIAAGQRAGEISPGRRRGAGAHAGRAAPSPAPEPPPSDVPRRVAAPPPEPAPRVSHEEREQLRRLQYALGTLRERFGSKALLDWRLNGAAVAAVADGTAVVMLPGLARQPPPPNLLDALRRACRDALQVARVEFVDPAAHAAAAD